MAAHPAALVLADHLYHAQTRGADGLHTKGACECREWRGWIFDHPEHLADVLARAGLLAGGDTAGDTDHASPRREGRQNEATEITPGPTAAGRCPDDGACHHSCQVSCFRVRYCRPLSGLFPGDHWPSDVRDANAYTDEEWRL